MDISFSFPALKKKINHVKRNIFSVEHFLEIQSIPDSTYPFGFRMLLMNVYTDPGLNR